MKPENFEPVKKLMAEREAVLQRLKLVNELTFGDCRVSLSKPSYHILDNQTFPDFKPLSDKLQSLVFEYVVEQLNAYLSQIEAELETL